MRQALHHNSTSGARHKTTLDVTRASKVVTCLNTHPSWWTCLIKTASIPLHLNMWWIQHRWKTWQPKGQKSSHSSCWKGTTSPHLSNLLDHTETRRHLKQIGMDCDRQHFQSRHRIQDKNWQRIREVQKLIKESAKPKVFSKNTRGVGIAWSFTLVRSTVLHRMVDTDYGEKWDTKNISTQKVAAPPGIEPGVGVHKLQTTHYWVTLVSVLYKQNQPTNNRCLYIDKHNPL